MDELVRRLRETADDSAHSGGAADMRQAADAITTLTAALEGLVAAVVDLDEEGRVEESAAMQDARAALREVGR